MEEGLSGNVKHYTVRAIRIAKDKAVVRLSVAIDRGERLRRSMDRFVIEGEDFDNFLSAVMGDISQRLADEYGDATQLSEKEFKNLFKEKEG